MTDWQPIETAPKDGSLILLYFERVYGDSIEIAGWFPFGLQSKNRKEHRWRRSRWEEVYDGPTHWMPLPSAPKPAEPG
jgi:hypothetical protein